MAEYDAPLEQRVYGILQVLLTDFAHRKLPDTTERRGVVNLQDALDAILQIAAVIDEYTQAGAIPVGRGVHAGAMLMVVRDHLLPLPPGTSRDGHDRLTEDLQELVAALRTVREERGMLDTNQD